MSHALNSNTTATATATTAKISSSISIATTQYENMLLVAKSVKQWNDTEYKKSNDKLYALLQDCYKIVQETRTKGTAVVRELGKILHANGIKFNDGTRLETKVVRVVFGDIGKRAQIYSRVLVNAREQGVVADNVVAWLTEQGGVEAVRKQHKGLTPSQQKAVKKSSAELCFKEIASKDINLAPKHDSSDYTLALVHHSSTGKRIVAFCSNLTLINATLANLSAAATTEVEQKRVAQLERDNRALQRSIAKLSTQSQSKAA